MKLLHFTAEWCGPCKMMKPVINEVVAEYHDIEYLSVDIDENTETTIDYNVLSIPTFILVDNDDNVLARVTGAMSKQKFLDALGI